MTKPSKKGIERCRECKWWDDTWIVAGCNPPNPQGQILRELCENFVEKGANMTKEHEPKVSVTNILKNQAGTDGNPRKPIEEARKDIETIVMECVLSEEDMTFRKISNSIEAYHYNQEIRERLKGVFI